jgi:hypothetical protein
MKPTLLLALAALLAGCASVEAPTPEHLDAIGVKNGENALDALSNLGHEGFQCQASGARHEVFNCTKMQPANLGLSTCVTHLDFRADEKNRVEKLIVYDVACAGF